MQVLDVSFHQVQCHTDKPCAQYMLDLYSSRIATSNMLRKPVTWYDALERAGPSHGLIGVIGLIRLVDWTGDHLVILVQITVDHLSCL